MKRDMELARAILLKVEELPFDGGMHEIEIEGHDSNEVSYHVLLLHEAGLLEAVAISNYDGVDWRPVRLTYAGHEFLDTIRRDTIWLKLKSHVLASAGSLSIEALKIAAPLVLKQVIGARP